MKLVSFEIEGHPRYGAIKGGGVVDLTPLFAARGVSGLRGLLAAGLLDAARDAVAMAVPHHPLDGLSHSPVIPDPDKIICVGLNYLDHVAETGRTVTPNPALFARFAGSQVGHLQPMVRPGVSEEFDYEGELAVVIGTAGRHIPAACATGSATQASFLRGRPSPGPARSAPGW